MAMLSREHFPELRTWAFKVIGTDLASHVLEQARAGRYSQFEVNRGLPAKYLAKYFTKQGNDWVLDASVRAAACVMR